MGEPGGSPTRAEEGGSMGETWFPPRGGARRSRATRWDRISAIEGCRQHLEGANDARAVARDRRAVVLARDGARGSTSTRGAAARSSRSWGSRCRRRRARRSNRRLLVHRHLPLGLHVVEHDHLLAPDDGHLTHLVRVEPRQVHVRDLAAREAEEAEDDVLDAGWIDALPCAVADRPGSSSRK